MQIVGLILLLHGSIKSNGLLCSLSCFTAFFLSISVVLNLFDSKSTFHNNTFQDSWSFKSQMFIILTNDFKDFSI